VILLLIAVAGGLLAGWAQPAAGARTARPHLRHVWLVALGALLNAGAAVTDGDAAVLVAAASLAVLAAFAAANPTVTGIAVVGLGLLLNLAALVLNDGTPVRPGALVRAGVVERHELATFELDASEHLETDADRFAVLGEVLPVPVTNDVVSFGDLIIVVGVADATRELARRRRRRWSSDQRAGYVALTTLASVDHDWGTAPSGAAVSATQCSANPDDDAPEVMDLDKEAAVESSPDLVAASHSK
jgi:hypothetical protein